MYCVLTAMELIFFIAARMVLCFGLLITHQFFHCCWAVLACRQGFPFFPFFPLSMNRLGAGKKLEEDTVRTADPKWPKGYSIPYNIMLSRKKCEEVFLGEAINAWRLAGDQSICRTWWVIVFASLFLFVFASLTKLSLSWRVCCFCSSYSLPYSAWGAEEWAGCCVDA